MDETLSSLIDKFRSRYGDTELRAFLTNRLAGHSDAVLTIVCDDTMHAIPESVILGERFVLSSGNFDTTNSRTVEEYLNSRIILLANKLNSREWDRVRVVYSGHAILAAVAKFTVYRVLHIESDDVIYFGGIGYMEISVRVRNVLAAVERTDP